MCWFKSRWLSMEVVVLVDKWKQWFSLINVFDLVGLMLFEMTFETIGMIMHRTMFSPSPSSCDRFSTQWRQWLLLVCLDNYRTFQFISVFLFTFSSLQSFHSFNETFPTDARSSFNQRKQLVLIISPNTHTSSRDDHDRKSMNFQSTKQQIIDHSSPSS